jgi:Domain of Unknown Function (DUF1080)
MIPFPSRSDWSVHDGVLIGSAGMLATSRSDYADFRLRLELQVNQVRLNDIGFRSSLDLDHKTSFRDYFFNTGGLRGDDSIAALGTYRFKTGGSLGEFWTQTTDGLREITTPTLAPLKQGLWFKVEIIAIGNTFRMLVDDQEVSAFQDTESRLKKGRITLNEAGSGMRIRTIEIKKLNQDCPVISRIVAIGYDAWFRQTQVFRA